MENNVGKDVLFARNVLSVSSLLLHNLLTSQKQRILTSTGEGADVV